MLLREGLEQGAIPALLSSTDEAKGFWQGLLIVESPVPNEAPARKLSK
jgi:hypothetical protein